MQEFKGDYLKGDILDDKELTIDRHGSRFTNQNNQGNFSDKIYNTHDGR